MNKEQKMGSVLQSDEISGEPHIWVAVDSLRTCLCCCSRVFKLGRYLPFLEDSQVKQGISLRQRKQG